MGKSAPPGPRIRTRAAGTRTGGRVLAALLLAALEGPGYSPPPCASAPFDDVPAGSPTCPWIQELVARGITAGCGGGDYCPGSPVSRDQMAVFLTTTFSIEGN
ncbi:MAG: S-layer homology domain-containing protein [Thermoanaerobaculia bacterium]